MVDLKQDMKTNFMYEITIGMVKSIMKIKVSLKLKLIAVILLMIIYGCATTQRDWEKAIQDDNIYSYENFLKRHGKSKFSYNAQKRLAALYIERDWQSAVKTDSIDAYEAFIRRYGSRSYSSAFEAWSAPKFIPPERVGDAKSRIKVLRIERDWQAARSSDNIKSYEGFLRDHGTSIYAQEANKRLEELCIVKDWQKARDANDIKTYATFLSQHGESQYAEEARILLNELQVNKDWETACSVDEIESYEAFLRDHPESNFIAEARSRLNLYKSFFDGWYEVLKTATPETLQKYILQNPQSPYVMKAKAAVKDMAGRDIIDFLNEGKIEIKMFGSGIQSVTVRIRRKVPYKINVIIPLGSYFVSSMKAAQNMVATEESSVRLTNNEWVNVFVSAACANRGKAIPHGDVSFTVQRSSHQEELAKLMPVLDKAGASYDVRQAAVWIVTDNADWNDLGVLVSRPVFQLSGGTRAIKEQETAFAMKICANAGIEIRNKAIWKDREKIYLGLTRGDSLKKWLEVQDTSLAYRIKEKMSGIETKIASIDKLIIAPLTNRHLSIYLGVAYDAKGIYARDPFAIFLQKLGHKVELSTVDSGNDGVTVHYQDGLEAQAQALSQIAEIIFGSKADTRKIGGKYGITTEHDLVIWLR